MGDLCKHQTSNVNGSTAINTSQHSLTECTEEDWNSLVKKSTKKKRKVKREAFGDAADLDGFKGPWASYSIPTAIKATNSIEPVQSNPLLLLSEPKYTSDGGEYSILHQSSRSIFTVPDLPKETDICSPPTRILHTLTGHNQGIFTFKIIPVTFHLMLTCSLDHKIKLWDLYIDRKCIRTYYGHNKAVRDIAFSHDGTSFLSASLDRTIKLWHTESGRCMQKCLLEGMPFVVTFHPTCKNEFFVGTSDGCITHYSIQSDDCTTESFQLIRKYEGHLNSISTLMFLPPVQDKIYLLSSAEDKSCRIWDVTTGLSIRSISNTAAISILTQFEMHPKESKFLIAQSSKNRIVTFKYDSYPDPALTLQQKHFFGYRLNGYSCGIAISPDGKFVASGDGDGNVIFWEWEKALFIQKIHVHDKPIMHIEWHPMLPVVITCSLDGLVKVLH